MTATQNQNSEINTMLEVLVSDLIQLQLQCDSPYHSQSESGNLHIALLLLQRFEELQART